MNTRHSQSGFTIIEAVIYMALFVFIIAAVLLATYSMIESTDKSQYRSLIHNEGQFSIAKFRWLLNGATNISAPTPGSLVVTNTNISTSPIILQRSGSRLQLTLDGSNIDLSGDVAPVTELVFTVSPTATPPTQVSIQFRMQNKYYDENFSVKQLVR